MLRHNLDLDQELAPPSARRLPATRLDWVVALGLVGLLVAVGLVYSRWLDPLQWDADEGILLMTARMMGQGYPLYSEIWADQPPGVPLSILLAFRWLGESVEVGRLVTVLYGLVGLGAVALLAYSQAGPGLGRVAALAGPLLLAVTPNFFWLTRTVIREIQPQSVGMLALGLAMVFANSGRHRWLFLAGLVFGGAIWLKLSVGLLVIPLVLFTLLGVWRQDPHPPAPSPTRGEGEPASPSPPGWERGLGGEGAGRAALTLGAGGLLALLPLPVFFNITAFIRQVMGTPIAAREVWPNRADEYSQWIVEYLLVDNLALTALAALGLWALYRQRRAVAWVNLLWLVSVVVFLVNQRPLFAKHHFAFIFFPLAVLAGIGVAAVWRTLRQGRRAGLVNLTVVGAALLFALLHTPRQATLLQESIAPAPYRSLGEAAAWVAQHSQPGDFVVADPPMIAFRAQRNQVPWLVVQSSKRIQTGQLTDEQAIAAMEKYRPTAIALWNGRLDRLDGYTDWISQHYVAAVRDGERTLWQPFESVGIQHPQVARLGNVAEFLGYDVAFQGQELALTLYWRGLEPTPIDYTIFAQLVGGDGKGYGQRDGPPDGGRAMTSTWAPGQLVVDRRTIPIRPGAPRELQLYLGLYDLTTGARLPVFEGERRIDGDQIILKMTRD